MLIFLRFFEKQYLWQMININLKLTWLKDFYFKWLKCENHFVFCRNYIYAYPNICKKNKIKNKYWFIHMVGAH